MSKKLYTITVRGNEKTWCLDVYAEPEWVDSWRSDGLEVDEIENVIPMLVPPYAVRVWCAIQDLINFKNPFGN